MQQAEHAGADRAEARRSRCVSGRASATSCGRAAGRERQGCARRRTSASGGFGRAVSLPDGDSAATGRSAASRIAAGGVPEAVSAAAMARARSRPSASAAACTSGALDAASPRPVTLMTPFLRLPAKMRAAAGSALVRQRSRIPARRRAASRPVRRRAAAARRAAGRSRTGSGGAGSGPRSRGRFGAAGGCGREFRQRAGLRGRGRRSGRRFRARRG